MILRRTPHTVTLKRPAVSRDADNNVATLDYASPSLTRSAEGMFQTRGGEVSVGDEGQIVPFDAVFYSLETDFEVNDRVEVALDFFTGNFRVTAVSPKGRMNGDFSHTEVFLQKDGVR